MIHCEINCMTWYIMKLMVWPVKLKMVYMLWYILKYCMTWYIMKLMFLPVKLKMVCYDTFWNTGMTWYISMLTVLSKPSLWSSRPSKISEIIPGEHLVATSALLAFPRLSLCALLCLVPGEPCACWMPFWAGQHAKLLQKLPWSLNCLQRFQLSGIFPSTRQIN